MAECAIPSNHMECGLCLDIFVDPRILNCGHTFCLRCIKQQVICGETPNKCAICRQPWTIPKGGSDSLPKNYGLEAIVSAARLRERERIADKKSCCTKHTDQKLAVYCVQCSTLACAVCGLTLHRGHPCIETREADEKFRIVIAKEITALHCLAANQGRELAELKQSLQKANQTITLRGVVDDNLDSIVQADDDEAKLKKVEHLQQTVEEKQQALNAVMSSIRDCEHVLSDECAAVDREAVAKNLGLLEKLTNSLQQPQLSGTGRQVDQQNQHQYRHLLHQDVRLLTDDVIPAWMSLLPSDPHVEELRKERQKLQKQLAAYRSNMRSGFSGMGSTDWP